MELEFKNDFRQAGKRWDAFWRGENTRPMIRIVVPKKGAAPGAPPPYLAGHDGVYEPAIDQLLEWAASYDFVGEAMPYYILEFGPDTFSAYLGADLDFGHGPHTSWCVPFIKDWDETEIKFRRGCVWWQRTVEFAKAIRARCDGKLLIAPPTLVANLDSLAAMRGIENLLADMVDCPEKVKRALDGVCRAHSEILQAYSELFAFDAYGSVNVEGFYTSGRHSRPQCDMSCMISVEMFKEFVVPALEREAADSDTMVYHLDGPGAIKHLETLCAMERLDLISWVPGSQDPNEDWKWLYDKIVGYGKGYTKYIEDHGELLRMCERPESRKLCLGTWSSSKMEAEDLVAEAEKRAQASWV